MSSFSDSTGSERTSVRDITTITADSGVYILFVEDDEWGCVALGKQRTGTLVASTMVEDDAQAHEWADGVVQLLDGKELPENWNELIDTLH